MRELLGIQYMRALALIYSYRVPRFKETQIEFDPIQKRNLNPKRQQKTRLSVDRPIDRPMPRSIGPVDRAYPRARLLQSVDWSRSIAPPCARPCTLVDRAGRPGHRPRAQIACSMRRSLFLCRPISVLSSSISISSIFSLPTYTDFIVTKLHEYFHDK